jgi:hypothetical protein
MSREPGIVDVMAFYLDLLSRLQSMIGDHGWGWIAGMAIALIILTADRRRPRP